MKGPIKNKGARGSMAMAGWFLTALALTLLVSAAQADGGDRDPQIYHSSSTLSQDLKAMMERFRVFIYPELSSTSCDLRKGGPQAGLENFFFAKLAASDFVTSDPEEADLFVLPVSIWCIQKSRGPKAGNAVRRYIQEVRDSYPYWHRALGADHVFISCKGFKPDASRNVLELKKNAIQVGCFPMTPGEELFPHKDITMPPLPPAASNHLGLDSRRRRRSILAYYSSSADIPFSVRKAWEKDPGIATGAAGATTDLLTSSSFCISSGRKDRALILDALRHGCIPVIFTDEESRLQDLPLQDVLDWRRFSLILASSDMAGLRSILQGINEEETERMRDGGRLAAKRMEWNEVPKPLDAFYMVMYQLWGRHYTTRYADQ